MKASKMACMAGVFLAASAFTAQAEMKIQNAIFNENKGAMFVKGKSDADKVYVVNASTNSQIAVLSTRKGQFRADIQVGGRLNPVPCTIQIQTNAPGGGSSWWGRPTTSSDPGDFSVANVMQAPENCQ